ncbi:MAG TPA: type II toxin-antitoxin system VapC family toxin [Solirubrobacterales bacterium]|nr:type II toxin-antitoxin system VapC family toxin [Solirubrobacterales bacterium]
MKLLLDTHTLIWTLLDQSRFSSTSIDAIKDESNQVFVSVLSAWEIEIKRAKGKLPMPTPVGEALEKQRFATIPVTLDHVLAVESLPRHHRDPFDRMLIAQAQLESMTLITSDRTIRKYPVAVLPAA